jgi:hypothetical protein
MENKTRPTEEIRVGNHTIVVKTYATGREFNEIQAVYLRNAKINMVGNAPQVSGFTAEVELEATKKALEMLVVSVDGSSENVVSVIEEFPNDEYQKVVEKVNALLGKKK